MLELSLHILYVQFASRAKKVQSKPVVNEVVDDRTLTRRLEKRVKELEKQLAQKTTLVGLVCQEGVEVITTNDAAYFIEQKFFQTYSTIEPNLA